VDGAEQRAVHRRDQLGRRPVIRPMRQQAVDFDLCVATISNKHNGTTGLAEDQRSEGSSVFDLLFF
jgi:hypothetical protein